MYERLSNSAERVIREAELHADELSQEYVGTEHVLLALASTDKCDVCKLLDEHGASLMRLRETVGRLVKDKPTDNLITGALPLTLHYRNVMTVALERAKGANLNSVSTGHLLSAVIHEKGSVARAALEQLGVDIAKLEDDLVNGSC